jgi:arginase family enzyme
VSRLRAKCPDCKTYTAVALGPDYECHACGREFSAGLVRVPRAWGEGGERMVEAASLPLPYPETVVVEEDSLSEQSLALATQLPERPLVLGGCCCAHVGVVEGLAASHKRLALVWFDAHGDLNTPESSPSGNAWGMPLRMLIDSGAVDDDAIVLVGARRLDPAEEEFIGRSALHVGADEIEDALEGSDGVYVAVDCDSLDATEVTPFMPEPGGLSIAQAERLLQTVRARGDVLGAGFSGLAPEPRNVAPLTRLCSALGL